MDEFGQTKADVNEQ